MFMRRRRPLLGAAMLGGTAIAAHRAGERRAMEEQEEATQEARLEELERRSAGTASSTLQRRRWIVSPGRAWARRGRSARITVAITG